MSVVVQVPFRYSVVGKAKGKRKDEEVMVRDVVEIVIRDLHDAVLAARVSPSFRLAGPESARKAGLGPLWNEAGSWWVEFDKDRDGHRDFVRARIEDIDARWAIANLVSRRNQDEGPAWGNTRLVDRLEDTGLARVTSSDRDAVVEQIGKAASEYAVNQGTFVRRTMEPLVQVDHHTERKYVDGQGWIDDRSYYWVNTIHRYWRFHDEDRPLSPYSDASMTTRGASPSVDGVIAYASSRSLLDVPSLVETYENLRWRDEGPVDVSVAPVILAPELFLFDQGAVALRQAVGKTVRCLGDIRGGTRASEATVVAASVSRRLRVVLDDVGGDPDRIHLHVREISSCHAALVGVVEEDYVRELGRTLEAPSVVARKEEALDAAALSGVVSCEAVEVQRVYAINAGGLDVSGLAEVVCEAEGVVGTIESDDSSVLLVRIDVGYHVPSVVADVTRRMEAAASQGLRMGAIFV